MAGSNDVLGNFIAQGAFDDFAKLHEATQQALNDMLALVETSTKVGTSLSGSRSLTDLTTNTQAASTVQSQFNQKLLDLQDIMKQSDVLLQTYGTTLKQAAGALVQDTQALDANKASLAALKKELADGNITQDQYVQRATNLTAKQGELKAAVSESRIALNAAGKEQIAAATSADELSLRLGRLRDTYRGLSVAEKESADGQALKNYIQQLDPVVKKTNESLGNFQDSVGNYAKGVGGASTISERFTSIVERMGLRFAANLLIFQAAIEVYQAIEVRVKAAADATNVAQITMGEIAKASAGNFNEEAVAIALLKDRFEAATSTMSDKQEVVKELNDKIKDQYQAINNVNDAEAFFRDKSGVFIEALNARAEAAGALQVKIANYQKLIETAANPETTLDGIDKTAAAVGAFLNVKVGNGQNIVDQITNRYGLLTKTQADVNLENLKQTLDKANALADKYAIDAQNRANKLDTANGFKTDDLKGSRATKPHDNTNSDLKNMQDETLAEAQEYAKRGETAATYFKMVADDETQSLQDRVVAFRAYMAREEDDQQVLLDAQKQKIQESLDTIDGIEKKSVDKRTQQEKDLVDKKELFTKQLATLDAQDGLNRVQNADKTARGILAINADETNKRLEFIKVIATNSDEQEAIALKGLDDKLAAGTISYQEYTNQRKAIDAEYQKQKQLDIQAYLQKEIDELKAQGVNTEKLQDALNKAFKDGYADDVKAFQDAESKKAQYKQQIAAKEQQLAQEAITAVQALIDDQYQKEIAQDEAKLAAIETNKQAQIDAINASAISQTEKTKEIAEVTAQAAAQTQQLQKEENEIKRRQAIADKTAAIAKIIESTAVAVISALELPPPYGEALAVVVGAIGAAQLAVAAAAPIPQYRFGEKDKPVDGLAILGDGYERELVTEPGKAPYWSEATPTLYDLPKHTQVVPEHEIMKAASSFGMMTPQLLQLIGLGSSKNDNSDLKAAYKHETDRLVSAISNKPETTFVFRNGEIVKMVKRGSSTTTFLNKNNA